MPVSMGSHLLSSIITTIGEVYVEPLKQLITRLESLKFYLCRDGRHLDIIMNSDLVQWLLQTFMSIWIRIDVHCSGSFPFSYSLTSMNFGNWNLVGSSAGFIVCRIIEKAKWKIHLPFSALSINLSTSMFIRAIQQLKTLRTQRF